MDQALMVRPTLPFRSRGRSSPTTEE